MGATGSASESLGGHIVLALLHDRPGSAYDLDRRLAERFRSAGYSQGMANSTVKRLAAKGLVRVVDGGQNDKTTIYEPTPEGEQRFRKWMRSVPDLPPVREDLLSRVMLSRPADIPRLIDVVREVEMAFTVKLQSLNWRIQDAARAADAEDWSERMRLSMSSYEQMVLDAHLSWLGRLREHLQEEWRRWQEEQPHAGGRRAQLR